MSLLSATDSLLLIIDIQDRLLPVVQGGGRVETNADILLQAAASLGIPVLLTEQYPKGLGATVASIRATAAAAPVLEKLHFSAYADPAIRTHVDRIGKRQAVLAGLDAHVCVLQAALALAEAGHDVYVVADAIASRQQENFDLACRRLTAAGVTLVSTEMCIFEWLGSAGHSEFKRLSKLIK